MHGCLTLESGAHGCTVGGHARDFLFPPPFDIDRGNQTLRELGFTVHMGGTSIYFMGEAEDIFVRGAAADYHDASSNWTLTAIHRQSWVVQDERPESPEAIELQQRSKTALEVELRWFLPRFEDGYGSSHESFTDSPAGVGCE